MLVLLREILDRICFVIVYFPGCDIINFEINILFVTKPFLYDQKLNKKIKYFENENSF